MILTITSSGLIRENQALNLQLNLAAVNEFTFANLLISGKSIKNNFLFASLQIGAMETSEDFAPSANAEANGVEVIERSAANRDHEDGGNDDRGSVNSDQQGSDAVLIKYCIHFSTKSIKKFVLKYTNGKSGPNEKEAR